jgi:hypothetical protein
MMFVYTYLYTGMYMWSLYIQVYTKFTSHQQCAFYHQYMMSTAWHMCAVRLHLHISRPEPDDDSVLGRSQAGTQPAGGILELLLDWKIVAWESHDDTEGTSP